MKRTGTLRLWLLIPAILAIGALVAFSLFPKQKNEPPQSLGKEEAINSYIKFLSASGSGENENSVPWAEVFSPGMGTASDMLPSMSIEDAEKQGLLSAAAASAAAADPARINGVKVEALIACAKQQHDLIVEQFGSDAWANVSYTLEEIDSVDGALGYRLIETGALMTKEKYDQTMRDYWNAVAQKEQVNYYDIFLRDDETEDALAGKRTDLIVEYMDDMPAELTLVSDTKTLEVRLAFYGAEKSKENYEDFHFIICGKENSWVVFGGLSWSAPYPDTPTGD